jgi:hypothetical protein
VALPAIGSLWTFARKVDDLFALHNKVEASLQVIDERLRALEDRMLKLESGQGQVITEARNAAAFMASGVIAETVTRITRLEGRTEQLEQRRLPPA